MIFRFSAAVLLLAGIASGADDHKVLINAAGATFPYPLYSKWFEEFHKESPNVQINYQPIGSGNGIQQVIDGTVDFGASDGPMSDLQIKDFQNKRGVAVLHFPTLVGAVVPTYNVPGVTGSVNFTGEVLAAIFLGTITRWDDPELIKINPGVKLPASNIVVVHRSDSSGTTYVWTDYLSKISAQWASRVGKGTTVNWPVGLSGRANEGVAECIQLAPNSIGYVELTYALLKKMTYGKVRNSAGEFVQANSASVTEAAAGASMPDDFRVSITNPSGKGAYPISSFTWLLIPAKIAAAQKREVIKNFVLWMLSDGQRVTGKLFYVPLPQALLARETKAAEAIR